MDYAAKVIKAREMLRANGRAITLSTLNPDTSQLDKPWRSATDPRDIDQITSTTVYALPASGADEKRFTEMYLGTTIVFICEVGTDTPEDFDQYQTVTDGDREFKITFIKAFKPGTITIFYYVGVAS